jgi:hypothetical protein
MERLQKKGYSAKSKVYEPFITVLFEVVIFIIVLMRVSIRAGVAISLKPSWLRAFFVKNNPSLKLQIACFAP